MNNSRRKFIKQSGGLLPLLLSPFLFSNLKLLYTKQINIDEINLFLINVNKERNFSHGVWKNRQHVMINIKGGDHVGWGETKVSSNQPNFDITTWSKEFKKIDKDVIKITSGNSKIEIESEIVEKPKIEN